MEELESLLVSVKAWASKLLEALGLCRSNCASLNAAKEALEIENAGLLAENARLTELLKVPATEVGSAPAPEFDLSTVLVWMTEFKALAEAIQHDVNARASELSGTIQEFSGGRIVSARIDQLDLYIKERANGLSAGQNELHGDMVRIGYEIRASLLDSVKDVNKSTSEVNSAIAGVKEQVNAIPALAPAMQALKTAVEEANKRPALDAGTINDFMAYVRAKLQKLPF